MATLMQLKRRIRAARNVSKTTRAMQMIAASKLKKAQLAAVSSKPYVEKLTHLVTNIAPRINDETSHPYFSNQNNVNKTLLIVFSPDKGLCGGLITNLIREFIHYNNTNAATSYVTIGKKIEGQIARFKKEIIASFLFGNSLPAFDTVYAIARIIDEYYLDKKVDSVKILSTQFSSIFSQKPIISTILPISVPPQETEQEEAFSLFEPTLSEILPSLTKHYLEMVLYQHLLESFVSEQASRMIAMQNATNNAGDIIQELQLDYNKSRQAKITSEILDISSSSIALSHEQNN